MTPGNHPIIVRMTLIKNSVFKPCFKKTAKGGNKMLSIIVNNDMFYVFWFDTKLD